MTIGLQILLLTAIAGGKAPQRAELDRQFASELEQLAQICEEQELPRQAQHTRDWIVTDNDRNILFLVLPSDTLEPGDAAPILEQQWYRRFRQIRDEHADALFKHARQLLEVDQAAESFRTLHEVLRHNPDHVDARRILGYQQVSGKWRRPGVETKVSQPRFDHPKLPWGARDYWIVETTHFEILTNHSREAGLELAQRLEIVYSVWEQMFFSFWSSQDQLASYFGGASPSPRRRKFNVVLFADRAQYVSYLEPRQPRIGITQGLYEFQLEKAFLFHTEDPIARKTWDHEVSHQLFQEYRPVNSDVARDFNAWAIEGIAMYMESIRTMDGYVTMGGVDSSRLQFARNRYLIGEFYVPLNELAVLGRKDLQQREDIGSIYSQAAGLSHFLLDGQDRALREPFLNYITELYQGRSQASSLEKFMPTPLPQLDRQYQAFLQVTDAKILELPESGPTRQLALGRTQVTDRCLPHVATFENLTWLDLTGTQVSDSGVAHLKRLENLQDLSVASTLVTDAAVADVAQIDSLTEVDFSATRITDAGLAKLASLKNLQILRLAVTQISDTGLRHLHGLKNLQMLDIRRTQLSDAAVDQLKQAIPDLTVHR